MSDEGSSDLNARAKITPTKVEPTVRAEGMTDAERMARVREAKFAKQRAEAAAAAAHTVTAPDASADRQPEASPSRGENSNDRVGEMPAPRRPDPELAQQVSRADVVDQDHLDALGPGFVRIPFGQRSARLAAPSRPGYHRHRFNDDGERVARALAAGYKVVNVNGKPDRRVVGTSARGDGQYGVLMEIPLVWYEEDMRLSQKPADDIEATIRRGEVAVGDGSKRYVPLEPGTNRPMIDMRDEVQRGGVVPPAGG